MNRRVVCPGCNCLCDGLTLTEASKMPLEVRDCSVGSAWFAQRAEFLKANRLENQGSAACELDSAVSRVAALLAKAKFPLITGVENLCTQSQQAAVKVADRFSAGIDSGLSEAERGSMFSFQRHGKVTATLGEIESRSDLVIFWFCDPQVTHPKFLQRILGVDETPSKQIVVIDQVPTETAKIADEFIQIDEQAVLKFARGLRRELLSGSQRQSESLAWRMTAAKYGSVFVGKPSLASSLSFNPTFDAATDQWFQLVRTLNDHTRFVMSSLPKSRNGVGASNVLASLTGFASAVRHTDAGPIHNGLEYSTLTILKRRECDMLLVCDVGAARPFDADLDAATVSWLEEIPVVVLSDFPVSEYQSDAIHVPVGVAGWTAPGDFVRCDDVPIPMSALAESDLLSPAQFFDSMLDAAKTA